jgi:nucleoside-diphosphate-sugar epimerase
MADYLVTGGAGFLGSNLVRRLLAEGHSVTVFDSLATGRRENLEGLEGDLTFVKGDIRDNAALLEVFASKGFECAFHLAALPSVRFSFENPQEAHEVNATGTLNVLAVARALAVGRVVFASSCALYGDTSRPPIAEDAPAEPLSPYAAQKLLGEKYCLLYSRFLGVPAVALRLFNIYGPRQDPGSDYAAVVPKFLTGLLQGEPPIVYGDGEQTRDFVFVEDAVNACVLASSSAKAPGRVINIGSGIETPISKLAKLTASVAGVELKPKHGPAVPGEVRHSCADITLARNILGYSPATTLEQGLKKTLEFFKVQGSSATF